MYIIGIDFGHGETSAAMLEYQNVRIPEVTPTDESAPEQKSWNAEQIRRAMDKAEATRKDLSINGDAKVVKSVIYYDRQNENYYINPSFSDIKRNISCLKEGEEPYIRAYFKGPLIAGRGTKNGGNNLPAIGEQQEEAFAKFVKRVYDNIIRLNGLNPSKGDFKLYVACPSEWAKEPEQVRLYKEFLIKQGIPCEEVIAESRAAYMSYRDSIIGNSVQRGENSTTESMTENPESIDKLRKNILVIDFGSSTIDFTWYGVDSLQPVTDGSQHGAKQVEEDLFYYIREHEELAREGFEILAKGLHGDKDVAEDIMILVMRDIKEQFYKEILGNNPSPELQEIQIRDLISIKDPVTHKEMVTRDLRFGFEDDVYYRKKEVREILVKSGYYAAVEKAFVDFRDRKEVEGKVDHVILTGGASKMDFVVELVEEVFGVKNYTRKMTVDTQAVPHTGLETLTIDDNPSFSISRGIAKFGLYHYLSEPFKNQIDQILNQTWLNKSWLANRLGHLIPETVHQVYTNKMMEIIDNWAESNSSIVYSKEHSLYPMMEPIIQERKQPDGKGIWNYVEMAKNYDNTYTTNVGNHSLHALLSKLFDYIQTLDELKEIEALLNNAIQEEINTEVGDLLNRYVSIYFTQKEVKFDTKLDVLDKIKVSIKKEKQKELLINLLESAFKRVAEIDRTGYSGNTLDKDRFPNTSIFNTTRKELAPPLKEVIKAFAEQIEIDYPLSSFCDNCYKAVDLKYAKVKYECDLTTYRL